MLINKTLSIDSIANFERSINKRFQNGKEILMVPGTLKDRYQGITKEESAIWLRTQFHSLFIIASGIGKVSVGDNSQEVVDDQLVIVPENLSYKIEDIQFCIGYCLHFHSEFLKPILPGHLQEHFPYFNLEGKHVFRLTIRESRLIQNCFKDIIRAYGHQSREKESLMRDFLHILLLHIRGIYGSFLISKPAIAKHSTMLATRFIHFVEQNFREMHGVRQYADLLNISPKYLTKIVNDAFGKSPQECIQDMLLLEAKTLLRSTDKTVSEIAYLLSFSDQSHFSHFVKQHTGKTPLQFRQQV